jgi:predicted dinucleotide-binding enzyme
MARLNSDPNYSSYRDGYKMKRLVSELLKASGVDLTDGGAYRNSSSFKHIFLIIKLLLMMG